MASEWMGDVPANCDICHSKLRGEFVDGSTKMGPWAIMCPKCHRHYGNGLGLGRGQHYQLQNGKYLKVEE